MTDQMRRKTKHGTYVHEACAPKEEHTIDYGQDTHKQQQQQQQQPYPQILATESPHKSPELSLRAITLSPNTPPANRIAPVYLQTPPHAADDGLYGPLLTSPPRSPNMSPAAAAAPPSAINPAPPRPIVVREETL
jgi:hypothetical protein